MEQFETHFKQIDVLPMVKHYMDELDLFNLFKKYVPATSDCLIEHAESLCILTANIICDNKPLYKIQKWLSKYSDGLTNEPIEASLFNDDRLAKGLSKLFAADRDSLMTELSCNSIRIHKLLTDDIHNDSTTVTFIGDYKNQDDEAVKLKHGHNKDFRPDCKQVVFGLNITADGNVPLSFKLFDGNTTDDTTHIPNWNGLRALLGKEDFIYIADCKLCSEENLIYIARNDGFFITIIPKNRKEVKQFYKFMETNDIKWNDGFEIASSRKKEKIVTYRTYEAEKTDNGFRIIWVHSSSKEEDEKKSRLRRIEKACQALEELSPKLNAYHLKTKQKIQDAVDKICKGVKDFLPVKIITERKQIKVKISPGRPSIKSVYKNKWKYKYSIEWKTDEKAISIAERKDGVFPLITNTSLDASEVLKKYKNQPFLEKRMYTKKTVLEVAPVFLKKPHRIEAMLFLYFVALMIVSLIERKIRLNMQKEEIEKIPILPQGMNSKKPTWNNIRYFFQSVHRAEIIRNDVLIQAEIKGLTILHKEINRLLEVPPSIYRNLKNDWWRFGST